MILIGACIAGFVWIHLSTLGIQTAEDEMSAYAGIESKNVETRLVQGLQSAKTLASVFSVYLEKDQGLTREEAVNILRKSREDNPDIFGYFIAFEPNAFDNQDASHVSTQTSDETGRFLADVMIEDGKWIIEPIPGIDKEEFYREPKNTKRPYISEPYLDVNTLIVSVSIPVIVKDSFVGVVGTEIPLTSLQKDADAVNLYNNQAVMTILDPNGHIIASTNHAELIGEIKRDMGVQGHGISATHEQSSGIRKEGGDLQVNIPMSVPGTDTTWRIYQYPHG
jgi:predicted small secreted protein